MAERTTGIYKNRFLLGVYEKPEEDSDDDQAVAILDNPKQLAEFAGMTVRCAVMLTNRLQHGRKPDIEVGGKTYQIFLIEYED